MNSNENNTRDANTRADGLGTIANVGRGIYRTDDAAANATWCELIYGPHLARSADKWTQDAIARRIVAVWNACDGFTLQTLEAFEPGALASMFARSLVAQHRDTVRDATLESWRNDCQKDTADAFRHSRETVAGDAVRERLYPNASRLESVLTSFRDFAHSALTGTAHAENLAHYEAQADEALQAGPDPVRIVVTLEGGSVNDISANVPAEYVLVDFDTDWIDEDEGIIQLRCFDFRTNAPSDPASFDEASVLRRDAVDVCPEFVAHRFAEALAHEAEANEANAPRATPDNVSQAFATARLVADSEPNPPEVVQTPAELANETRASLIDAADAHITAMGYDTSLGNSASDWVEALQAAPESDTFAHTLAAALQAHALNGGG